MAECSFNRNRIKKYIPEDGIKIIILLTEKHRKSQRNRDGNF